jgi:hypothetical protein
MQDIVENVVEAFALVGVLVALGLALRGSLQMREQQRREQAERGK